MGKDGLKDSLGPSPCCNVYFVRIWNFVFFLFFFSAVGPGNRNTSFPHATPNSLESEHLGTPCRLKMNFHIYCHLTWADLAIPTASTRSQASQALGTCQPIWQLVFLENIFLFMPESLHREHSVPWIKARAVWEPVAFQPLLLASALQIWIENIKKRWNHGFVPLLFHPLSFSRSW